MTSCTCKISRTTCTMAFVYGDNGETVAEIPIELTFTLRPEFTALCAGAALQKLNRERKSRHEKENQKH